MANATSPSKLVFDQGTNHSSRILQGYGQRTPDPKWPGGAKVCVSFVLNYEEGGEHVGLPTDTTLDEASNLNADGHAETFLTESGATATVGTPRAARNLGVESSYEFGARRGFWRMLDLFERKQLRFTSWAVGRAVQLNPQVVPAMQRIGCEVASHSWRWIDYAGVEEEEERKHIRLAIEELARHSKDGKAPSGWYTGRQSLNTRRLVYETYRDMGILDQLYDSDAYDEDLPYYIASPSPSSEKPSPPLLVIPYTLDNNDMKFGQAPGFSNSSDLANYLRDALDTLLAEGERGQAKMVSIGLHCRVVGRPGRFRAFESFVQYVKELESKGEVWVATREEIAQHWRKTHPAPAAASS